MSNKLVRQPDKMTITAQQMRDMERAIENRVRSKITQEIYEKIKNTVASMQAQALYLSFGLALREKHGFSEKEITDVFTSSDEQMAKFWHLEDLEAFRSYVNERCGFDVRIPGYADEETEACGTETSS